MRKKMHTLYLFECEDVLAAAFFRTSLDQLLSKHDQPYLLRPFGRYITDDRAPFAFWINSKEQGQPTKPGQDKKDCEGVFVHELKSFITVRPARLAALARSLFEKPFCGQDSYHYTNPVGDCIAKERTSA